MTRFSKLTIWTIILDFLIVVAAGHGIGFLGLFEIFWFPQFYGMGTEDFSATLTGSFDNIGFVAFISLVGQLLLIITFILRQQTQIFWTKLLGLVFVLVGYFYLSYNVFYSNISAISFVTGLPFLIVSLILSYRLIKQKLDMRLS